MYRYASVTNRNLDRPDRLAYLTPLDEEEKASFGLQDTPATLAFRYESQPYAASIAVDRIEPWVTARTFNFLRLDPEGLTAHYEVIYDVRRASVRRLSLRLPESTPESLAIRGLDGVTVKETTSEVAVTRARKRDSLSRSASSACFS